MEVSVAVDMRQMGEFPFSVRFSFSYSDIVPNKEMWSFVSSVLGARSLILLPSPSLERLRPRLIKAKKQRSALCMRMSSTFSRQRGKERRKIDNNRRFLIDIFETTKITFALPINVFALLFSLSSPLSRIETDFRAFFLSSTQLNKNYWQCEFNLQVLLYIVFFGGYKKSASKPNTKNIPLEKRGKGEEQPSRRSKTN
jgi:hypothetical protein